MALEDVTYSCGHTGVENIYGDRAHRRHMRYVFEHYRLCPECEEKEREEKAAAARQSAEEMGFPELTGSEKQVAWAESIRQFHYEQITQRLTEWGYYDDKTMSDPKNEVGIRACTEAFREWFARTSAKWYIEHRDNPADAFSRRVGELKNEIESGTDPDVHEVFAPAEPSGNDIVVLDVVDEVLRQGVSLRYPKNEHFRSTVKSLGSYWSSECWFRPMQTGANSLQDLACDTVNALVAAGFRVQVSDASVRQMLHAEAWTPVNPRVIRYNEQYRRYAVETGGNDELYNLIHSLPHTSQYKDVINVPLSATAALADIADVYDFIWTVDAARQRDERLHTVVSTLTPRTEEQQAVDVADLRQEADLSDLIDD